MAMPCWGGNVADAAEAAKGVNSETHNSETRIESERVLATMPKILNTMNKDGVCYNSLRLIWRA
tara:strand:- start:7815 stop:8006 length:192 start_codon:yes stop_codon:yes gene_type:complete